VCVSIRDKSLTKQSKHAHNYNKTKTKQNKQQLTTTTTTTTTNTYHAPKFGLGHWRGLLIENAKNQNLKQQKFTKTIK
jgi:hypothetical protein